MTNARSKRIAIILTVVFLMSVLVVSVQAATGSNDTNTKVQISVKQSDNTNLNAGLGGSIQHQLKNPLFKNNPTGGTQDEMSSHRQLKHPLTRNHNL